MSDLIKISALQGAYLGSRIFQHVSARLTGALGAFMWFIPLQKKAHFKREEFVCSSYDRPYQWKNRTIHFRTWGALSSPRHIVLLHGWGGRWDQFCELIDFLVSNGYKVSSLDFPAHGETPGFDTHLGEWFSILQMLQAEFSTDTTFISHSFGLAAISHAVLNLGLPAKSIIAVNPPNQFGFLVRQFSNKVKLNSKAEPFLVKKVLQRVREAQEVTTIPLNRLKQKLPVTYVVDDKDKEVPYSEHTEAANIFDKNFITLSGYGHNRILSAPEFHQLVLAHMKQF